MFIKQYINIAIVSIALLVLNACGDAENADKTDAQTSSEQDITILRVGVCPGPHGKIVAEGIGPILKKQNITVEVIEFPDYVQPNMALVSGDIQANVFQHKIFLQNTIDSLGIDIVDVTTVPTPIGMAAFSEKYNSFEQLQSGDTVLIPNDAVNTGRALRLARDAGIITLNQADINEIKASLGDIAENKYNVEFVLVDAAQISRSLDSIAVGFINGNFVLAAGLDFDDALITEKPVEELKNRVVVRGSDKETIGKILKEAVESEEFKAYIDGNEYYKGFSRPAWWDR